MQFVSIYRLAEICDIKTERLDIFTIRDLQNELKRLYHADDIELYQVGKKAITLGMAVDWLWKNGSTDGLNFCKWVHEIPGLEYYLETSNLDLSLSVEISDQIKKSFNFSRFGNFLDHNSLTYLDSIYKVGFGSNQENNTEEDDYDFQIKIDEKKDIPIVSFKYFREVNAKQMELF